MTVLKPLIAPLAALALFGHSLSAQCGTTWSSGGDLPWPGGTVHATTNWDPDGAGPATPLLVYGGKFEFAGNIAASNIVAFDSVNQTWLPLGHGFDGQVESLHVHANGELFAGGFFNNSGATSCNHIARWNGASWSAVGAGTNDVVYVMESLNNGDLVAGGEFTYAGGQPRNSIAAWDGTNWSSLGTGLTGNTSSPTGPYVSRLIVRPNGDLIATGQFVFGGGTLTNLIARWDGTSWNQFSVPPLLASSARIDDLVNLPNGDLLVAARFDQGQNLNYMARWDGTQWSWADQGLSNAPHSLHVHSNGTLLASGQYLVFPFDVRLVEWNGSMWVPFAEQPPARFYGWPGHKSMLTLPNGDLHINGDVRADATIWDGTSWRTPAPGTDDRVLAIADGDLDHYFVGGDFTQIGQSSISSVAEWNGTAWTSLGLGVDGPVSALTRTGNGDLYVAGPFSNAGGQPASGIARWDGSNWSPLGSGIPNNNWPAVADMLTMPNGDLIVAGSLPTAGGAPANHIARWDGTAWSSLGGGTDFTVHALLLAPNGDLIAGGAFQLAGGIVARFVARWDGNSWSAVGTGLTGTGQWDTVTDMTFLPNGDLVIVGEFEFQANTAILNNIARWDGTAWQPFGFGSPTRLLSVVALPDGSILTGGSAEDEQYNIFEQPRRWNGSSWSTANAGISEGSHYYFKGAIYAMDLSKDGTLRMGGDFVAANGMAASFLSSQSSACPATATPHGTGCPSSAGPVSQTVVDLPWLGSTFASNTSGVPSNALAIGVLGLNSLTTPLQSILPQGISGCTLQASPDVLRIYVPSNGTVRTDFAIVNTPLLIGAVLQHQVVPVEFDTNGNILALTSSNALRLTIGTF